MDIAEDDLLAALADVVGIEPRYLDVDGCIQQVSAETRRALLTSMGIDLSSADAMRAEFHARRDADWRRLLAPVIVLRRLPGSTFCTPLTLTRSLLAHRLEWRVQPERGAPLAGVVSPAAIEPVEQRWIDGVPLTRVRLPLPADLEDGYHRLTVAIGGSEAEASLIITPAAAFLPDWLANGQRRWGIACPLFSLWSDRSWGIGDFSDLAALMRAARDLGASIVGLNPLHAPLPGGDFDPNPYLPSSRLFLSPLHIDVAEVLGLEAKHFTARSAEAQDRSLVDYPLVLRLKQEALETGYQSRPRGSLAARQSEPNEALVRFAIFNALQERFASVPWQEWPVALRTPTSSAVDDFAREHADRIGFYIWAQSIADSQLAAAASQLTTQVPEGGLYRDLAIGVRPDGADAWAGQGQYVAGAAIGAPPDAFNPAGQDWGSPPPSPLVLQATGYAPFIAALQANMRHAKVLRIDHVMGLQRLYWIPPGMPATSGAYVRYPLDDLLGIVALESHRHRCLVIGEDLGTLPYGFHERMADADILSYRLMMFERYADGLFRRPATYPQLAVATFGTHDLPTIRSWWDGDDIDIRRTVGIGTTEEAKQAAQRRGEDRALLLAALRDQQLIGDDWNTEDFAMLLTAIERFVACSPAALMMVNLSDMLAEKAQINVPGTVSEYPNWRHRLRLPVRKILKDPLALSMIAAIAKERGTA